MKYFRKSKVFVFSLLSLVYIVGCSNDKEELLFPGSQICDPAPVKYSTTIVSIITASCYPCHTGNFPAGAVRLDNYADTRVNALNGRIYGSITHSPGYVPMPQGAPKLSDCKIMAIKKWIDEGAPNN